MTDVETPALHRTGIRADDRFVESGNQPAASEARWADSHPVLMTLLAMLGGAIIGASGALVRSNHTASDAEVATWAVIGALALGVGAARALVKNRRAARRATDGPQR